MKTRQRINWMLLMTGLNLIACGRGIDAGLQSHAEALTADATGNVVGISNQNLESNGTGNTLTDEPEVPVFTVSGSDGYDTRALVRFAPPALPAGSHVTAASMRISFE